MVFSILFTNTSLIQAKNETLTDKITKNNTLKNITLEDIFVYFSSFFEEKTPESYKYIQLNFSWLQKWSRLEKAIQILVYNDKLPNLKANLKWIEKVNVNSDTFYSLASKVLWTNYTKSNENKKVDYYDLELVEESYRVLKNTELYNKQINLDTGTKDVLNSVYEIILTEHFDKDKIDKQKLIYSATQWLANWTWDKHTTFFPPTESKDFMSSLAWDFYWIWTFVDMPEPWKFIITSPISWWPAEKAGIRWWDEVIEVDWKAVTKENSQNEIVGWIRWEEWTEVNLKIKRWTETLEIKVKREKVHMKSIETKTNWNAFIMKINWFNEGISTEFREAIEELKQKNIKKLIIDLRNNWGGYLDEVVTMLWYVIPKWEPVAVVKYVKDEWSYISKWQNLLDLNNYDVVFLQNSGTASASEIMIWTIKDYFPNVKIIWEKSYWKGSVQNIKEFFDGSSLKYTTAKWFTWKTKTWIDWVWIEPTEKVELDEQKLKDFKIDTQMDRALNI